MLQASTVDQVSCPLCLNFLPGNKAFPAFCTEFESSLEQFPAHPRRMNSTHCTEALIIGMFSTNHLITIVNQEVVKNIHMYLKQTEVNTPFWDDFYRIMKLWTKKIKSCADSYEMFWRKTQGAEEGKYAPALALLVSRATSPFLFFCWRNGSGEREKRKYYKVRV